VTLSEKFDRLRSRGEKALVLFVTAGDPPLDQLPQIVETLAEGGADVLEIGIPFSDPFGEGPTIQGSSGRALGRGTTPSAIFETLGGIDAPIPIVLMGYFNPVLRMGLGRFAQLSRESGSTGTIVSDLVPDEADAWCEASAREGLATIFLVAPTSTDERLRTAAQRSTGFVYCVSRTGVTGAERQVEADVSSLVRRVREATDRPACVGFGISSAEHVRQVCEVADGAVVGSALVERLHRQWDGGKGYRAVLTYVQSLKEATR
jgi:tryptophan synthase alpha chain